jgi:HAD superfamily hydrolase (TIGR01509 family)
VAQAEVCKTLYAGSIPAAASNPVAAMPPTLHIFDCDGVLVDSEVLATRIESQLLRDFGVELTPESIAEAFVGISDAEMHGRIEADWGVSLPADFTVRRAALLDEVFRSELRAVTGIAGVLEALDEPRCVASSSSPDRIRTSLTVTGLDSFFGPHVFSASHVERGKPAPDLFLYAAHAMQTDPTRCVVIEDSTPGVAAGRAAGMQVVGFTGAGHCVPMLSDQLREAGAHMIAPDAEALLDMLTRSE